MTDKELLELAVKWFRIGADKARRLETGNMSHGKVNLEGFLARSYEYIEKHLKK